MSEPQQKPKRTIGVNFIELISKLKDKDDQLAGWIPNITKHTGFEIVQSDKTEPTEISMEEFLEMPFVQKRWIFGKFMFDTLKITVKCDPTKDYKIPDNLRDYVKSFDLNLHWLNTKSQSELEETFTHMVAFFGWETIKKKLDNNFETFNIWACTKALIYEDRIDPAFKFKHVITNFKMGCGINYESIYDQIVKNDIDIDTLVTGRSSYKIPAIIKECFKISIGRTKKYTESMTKLSECLK